MKEDETRDKAYRFAPCGDSDSFTTFFYETPYSIGDNITLLRNETIIASWWIPNNESWIFNDDFYQTLLIEVISFKNNIAGIEDMSFPSLNMNETEFNLNHPTIYNLSEPIPYEFAHIFGEIWFKIDFKSSTKRTEKNTIRKIFEKLIPSKWYFSEIIYEFCGHLSQREIIGLISIPISISVGTITVVIMLITIRRTRE